MAAGNARSRSARGAAVVNTTVGTKDSQVGAGANACSASYPVVLRQTNVTLSTGSASNYVDAAGGGAIVANHATAVGGARVFVPAGPNKGVYTAVRVDGNTMTLTPAPIAAETGATAYMGGQDALFDELKHIIGAQASVEGLRQGEMRGHVDGYVKFFLRQSNSVTGVDEEVPTTTDLSGLDLMATAEGY